MTRGNIFDSIPPDSSEEIFSVLARGVGVKIERIVSAGQSSPASGWYDQAQDEWVIVLRGEAEIAFEDRAAVHLNTGDYLNIPAHTRHRVAWTSSEPGTVWLAVHYE